jgi:tRNA threonylcarbamoyl adenosine modification protein YeaZ
VRTLVIDCATEACSAALFEGGALSAGAYEVIGRGHAERLVPLIAELPERGGRAIVVSLGPGSFTGVRIGLAAARALGLAWQAKVLGYPTLALVAAMAHETDRPTGDRVHDRRPRRVVRTGFRSRRAARARHAIADARSGSARRSPFLRRGSKARELRRLDGPEMITLDILPDARRFPLLPQSLLTANLAPLYGRPPDARLPA